MVLSLMVGSIGTGLLSTIGLGTDTVRWAAYMVLTGVGIGIGVQLPYTAAQAISTYVQSVPPSNSRTEVTAVKRTRRLQTVSEPSMITTLSLIISTAIIVFFSQLGG